MSELLFFWFLYDILRSDGLFCLSNKINIREIFLLCGILKKYKRKKKEIYGFE